MRLGDSCNAADERGDAERPCMRGEVGGYERRLGGQGAAPGREMIEIGPIGPAGVLGDAGLDPGEDLVRNGVGSTDRAGTCTNWYVARPQVILDGPSAPSLERVSGSPEDPFVSRDKWGLSRVMAPSETGSSQT